MACMNRHHEELTDGEGRCSVPMWSGGCPAGFCDAPAFGRRPDSPMSRDYEGRSFRADGRYSGYIPGLACPIHGGPNRPADQEILECCDSD